MIFRVIDDEKHPGWYVMAWGNRDSDPRFGDWLKDHLINKVIAKWRFNDGFPFWELKGHDENDLTLMMMTWHED